MNNKYKELHHRQQEEVNAFPLGFAFSDSQFDEMMKKWRLDPERDIDKIARMPLNGGFIRKVDIDAWNELCKRHRKERKEALASDKDGTGYIYDMFVYELFNHEYGYTCDDEDTLNSLGLTHEDIAKDERMSKALERAKKKVLNETEDW